MSDQIAEATETVAEAVPETAPKPTETVEFWRDKAREQEKRAKENAAAAKELASVKEAQKSDAEKLADRIAAAEAESASVPAKVSEQLRAHLVALHGIEQDKADLYLTATDPELLLKQVAGLVDMGGRKRNHVPSEGRNRNSPGDDQMAEFASQLFNRE